MEKHTRVMLNSAVLYTRLIIVTGIKLWATKILLRNLGEEDFGLYNLLAGIIVMFAFLKVAMANASQRFISVSLGKNDCSTKEIFYTSFVMHIAVGVLVMLCILIGGSIMVKYTLNIPHGKTETALAIIGLLSFSTFFTVISVPYDSMMISKENIPVLSIFVTLESALILIGAYVIGGYMGNRLMLYVIIIVSGTLLLFVARVLVCNHLYSETRFRFKKIKDYGAFKSISKYAGWNVLSSLLVIVRNQGFAILFNMAGGVIINAAYGIANQVNGVFQYCSEALMQPNRPVIMKEYGSGNVDRAMKVTFLATKMVLLVSSIVIVVLFVNMPYILSIWLDSVPKYTLEFCRIIIVATFFVQFSQGAKAMVEATGHVKELFAHIGFFHLGALLLGVIIYLASRSIIFAILPFVIEEIACSMYRVFLMKKYTKTILSDFVKECILMPLLIASGMITLLMLSSPLFSPLCLLCLSLLFSCCIIPVSYYSFILNQGEKEAILRIVKKILPHKKG